ncbi:MAG: DUF5989 family protein [Patescibacteria group bacterium]
MKFLQKWSRTARVRLETLSRLFAFLWLNKLWWMIPLIFVLVIFGLVLLFAQSSPLGPFIYTLF